MKRNTRLAALGLVLLLLLIAAGSVVIAQSGPVSVDIFFRAVAFRGPLYILGQEVQFDADGDTLIVASTDDVLDIQVAGSSQYTLTASYLNLTDNLLIQQIGVENRGGLPSVVTATVEYSMTTSTPVITIADGEIWLVVDVIYEVTTSFDCTGDDCTFDLGDSGDVDGLLDCADAQMQSGFTDYTGAPAGWGGLDGSAPTGAYIVGGPHVYAPSGAAETIDVDIGGTTPAAGEAVVYIFYYRLQ